MRSYSTGCYRRWRRAPRLKAQKQSRKHSLGLLAHVVPKLKLAEVLPQMFAGHVDMSAADRALHDGPRALDAVHVVDTANIFFRFMIDGAVRVALLAERRVGPQFIGADRRA